MAATQIAGTPAPVAAPVSAATHGIDAVLGDLTADDVVSGEADESDALLGQLAGEAPATAEPEGEAEEPAPAAAPGRAPSIDDLLTDEALSTPEGVRASGEKLRELAGKQREAYLKLKGFEKNISARHSKLLHKVNEFKSERQTHQLLINNVRSNLQGLHSGDPETILTALGNLTGTDGLQAYELLTNRIVNRGQSKIDPQIQALLDNQAREIQALKGQQDERQQQHELAQLDQKINSHASRIGEIVRNSTTTPHLTRIFLANPAKLTRDIISVITEDNGATPAAELFAQMEAELQGHFGGPPQQGTNGGAVQQPQRAQRSPGQSVGPRTAASSTPRVPTEQEALQELANDQELLRSLGL